MATKKPPSSFNSAQAKAKWDSLQNSAGQSMSKIAQGQATTADFQKVSTTLGQLSTVARTVFDEAVDAAEKTALVVQEAGNVKITEGLTAFEAALNSALAVSFKETVQQIQDAFELDLLEQTEEITKRMGGKFADLELLLPPKDLPTVNDLLANNELLGEQLQKVDDERWITRSDDLLDRIFNIFKETLSNVRVKIPLPAPTGNNVGAYTKGRRHSMNPYELRTIADRGQSLLGEPKSSDTDVMDVDTTPISSTPGLKSESETSMTAVTSDKHADLFNRLERFLDTNESKGGLPEDDNNDIKDTKKEKEKADTWWRSFRGWMGDKFNEKKKKAIAGIGGILKDLAGVGLLSLIFNPQLWTTLAGLIEKYVTWDNIKGAAIATWDWMSDKANDVVDWVLDKLGIGKPKPSFHIPPAAQAAINAMPIKDRLAGMGPQTQAAAIEGMDPASKAKALADADPKVKAAYDQYQKEKTHANESWLDRGKGLANSFTTSVDSTVTSASNWFNNLSSGKSSRSGLTTGPSSKVAPPNSAIGTPVSIAPSFSMPANGTGTSSPGAGMGSSLGGATGSPQVGMGSFGFSSGVDDSLILMNSSFLGH